MSRITAEALDAEYPEAWRPKNVGDKILGEIVDLSEYDGGYGPYPIVTVKQDDGETLSVHAIHTVLKGELAEHRPKVGDRIGIKYRGMPEGKKYESYKVMFESPGRPIDWSKHADNVSAELGDYTLAPAVEDDPGPEADRPEPDDNPGF